MSRERNSPAGPKIGIGKSKQRIVKTLEEGRGKACKPREKNGGGFVYLTLGGTRCRAEWCALN